MTEYELIPLEALGYYKIRPGRKAPVWTKTDLDLDKDHIGIVVTSDMMTKVGDKTDLTIPKGSSIVTKGRIWVDVTNGRDQDVVINDGDRIGAVLVVDKSTVIPK